MKAVLLICNILMFLMSSIGNYLQAHTRHYFSFAQMEIDRLLSKTFLTLKMYSP